MFINFSTTSGMRIAINPNHVACVTESAVGGGCEVELASGRKVTLGGNFGKILSKMERPPAPLPG